MENTYVYEWIYDYLQKIMITTLNLLRQAWVSGWNKEQAGLIKYFQQVSQILIPLSIGSRSELTIASGNISLEYAVAAWQM